MDEVQISRSLHYVGVGSDGGLVCKPAIVVIGSANDGIVLELKVFYGQDVEGYINDTKSDHVKKTPSTWHWPRECDKLA